MQHCPRKSPKSLTRGIQRPTWPFVCATSQQTLPSPSSSLPAGASLRLQAILPSLPEVDTVMAAHLPDHPNSALHFFVTLHLFLDDSHLFTEFTQAVNVSGTE